MFIIKLKQTNKNYIQVGTNNYVTLYLNNNALIIVPSFNTIYFFNNN